MKQPWVFVILPVFNRLDDTRRFLECIRMQTYPNIRTVICNDGSTDGTGQYLLEQEDIVTIQGTGDLWWAGGINRCVNHVLENASDDDLVITVNNDVLLDPGYVAQKVVRSREMPGSIIGSLCVYQHDPDIIETSGLVMDYRACRSRSVVRHGTRRCEISLHGCIPATHLPGKGVLIPVKVYRELGIYDADNLPHYHADTDFTLRAHEHGIPVYVDFDSIVYSDVNLGNMNRASRITLKGIVRTFDSRRGVNSFPAYRSFAKNHFHGREMKYLLVTYSVIISGLFWRYLRSLCLHFGGQT